MKKEEGTSVSLAAETQDPKTTEGRRKADTSPSRAPWRYTEQKTQIPSHSRIQPQTAPITAACSLLQEEAVTEEDTTATHHPTGEALAAPSASP